MSQDYIFNFSNGLERSSSQDQHHNQIRRDKVRVQGFVPSPAGLDEGPTPVYETGAGMLSEMFNFPTGGPGNQTNYQHHRDQRGAGDWCGNSAQAMQLFLMNPPPNDQSPLLANTGSSSNSTLDLQQSFGGTAGTGQGHFGPSTQFPWDTQGLSLSLSSTSEQFGSAKVEEIRVGGAAGMLYFNHGDPYMNLDQTQNPIHVGFGSSSSLGVAKLLRNSRYVKAAQELLGEFCSVGRGQFTKNMGGSKQDTSVNDVNNSSAGGASSYSKDVPPLMSSAEKIEHQRRKVKLLSMLDEVDRRYNHYCEQMQMVVNSFDIVMGFGAAVAYTALAQKAMSRHFRCLKDAIAAQLKHSCDLLGEKDVGASGVTKGETPRLKILEQSLRQQRAFQQMGMMEQEAWRPQRGLPQHSLNILRAWLFEHFLHPYPSDADKHLLARQTGLSRNQVSNWFINARVRLWKPMVEDMYQQESKEEDQNQSNIIINNNGPISSSSNSSSAKAQTPTPPPPSAAAGTTTAATSLLRPTHDEDQDAHDVASTLISFGPTARDVSLTLGLRHAANLPDKNYFSLSDFMGS